MFNNINLTSILSGLSRTLNVADKATALFNDAKPIFNKAKDIISNINLNNESTEKIIKPKTEEEKKEEINNNNITFFQ